ncbi:MAG: MFS transporter [Sphaerobacteraceae bacterium]|nr:MAG: MFS transporter [Sphaerobacteraceae bacterium]
MDALKEIRQNPALLTFMLGHFTVDLYSGLLPVLYPLMALQFDLSNRDVGFVALSFMTASSISQPLFGYLADKHGSRYMAPASLAWAAIMFGVIGLSPSTGFFMFAAFMAGLGSGAYHPQGAANAAAAVRDESRNTAMSIYTVSGTGGYALGPIFGALIFGVFHQEGVLLMVPLGLLSAFLVYRSLVKLNLGLPERRASGSVDDQFSIKWKYLAPVVAVVMLRSWVFLSVVTLSPLWYQELGYSASFYGILVTAMLGIGALGTIAGGVLADRLGQRQVLFYSLLLSLPALYVFLFFPGPWALLTGALLGFLVDMSISVTLVMAQGMVRGRAGMASGFILGIGFVTGGIGVPITGMMADVVGIPTALGITGILLVVALVIVVLLPEHIARRTPLAKPAAPV